MQYGGLWNCKLTSLDLNLELELGYIFFSKKTGKVSVMYTLVDIIVKVMPLSRSQLQ